MDYNSRKEAVFETKRFRNCTIAAGRRHTVGLKSDGTLVTEGDNDYGQCDISGWSHIHQ
ncbi:RCC1 domain-containing protein [Paenibacillus sp. UASWS1643]|uniref:RCC1 domain-containing protein n=1 Tax=Paenibacillus sp. UASWS1643 TaxID=2580422 RepID=UPI00295ADB79|nr:RCC1 domain-containing protein [Paenibacillus sp. UASWS1643]